MKAKKTIIKSFGNHTKLPAYIFRPEKQSDLDKLNILQSTKHKYLLPVGNQLSYGDCCLNETLISSQRLNRFIDEEPNFKTITVEPGVNFKELLLVKKNLIPAVVPGTLHATIAGGVANDIHGKNQLIHGCLGHQINWLEIVIGDEHLKISKQQHSDLFFATIGGLGLTGFIRKININMLNQTKVVDVRRTYFRDIKQGIRKLKTQINHFDYSVAWFDPLHLGRGILLNASHTFGEFAPTKSEGISIPITPPFSFINKFTIKHFNRMFYNHKVKSPTNTKEDLIQFNNPLDKINNWNRLYGHNGLLQFQCIVPFDNAEQFIIEAFDIIKNSDACPSLAVMKIFGLDGLGLLSFAKPGITFAIDFPANKKSQRCIEQLNENLLNYSGRVYLAKDSFLTKQQFLEMYPNSDKFKAVLHKYGLEHNLNSVLAKRLGLTHAQI